MAKKLPKKKARKPAKIPKKKIPKKAKPLKAAMKKAVKKALPKKGKKMLKKAAPVGKKARLAIKKIPRKAQPKKAGKPAKTVLIQPSKPPELLRPPQTQLILPAPRPEEARPAIQRPMPIKEEERIKPEPLPERPPRIAVAPPKEKEEPILPEPLPGKEEKKEPVLEPKPSQPQAVKPALFQPEKESGGALAVELEPSLEQLPAWEDRVRLRRMIFEDGLKFQELSRSSPDFGQAFNLLVKTGRRGFRDVQGYFMICARDRSGQIIGALDGHQSGDILVLGRSAASGPKRRDLHILMYASALSGRNPKYVVFAGERKPLDFAYAGELIFLGRGFGMSAFAAELIIFIRRMGKELDPLSTGQEISMILSAMAPLYPSLGAAGSENATKSVVPLVPLPSSPDSREHLHELRDAAEALGLKAQDMAGLLEELKRRYIAEREEISPELI